MNNIEDNFKSIIDYENIVKKDLGSYAINRPFPHIVIDDFLRKDSLSKIIKNFPRENDKLKWRMKDFKDKDGTFFQKAKLVAADIFNMNLNITNLFLELNNRKFLEFLEFVTRIRGIIPDPYLIGGGIHIYKTGAKLSVHSDFNYHPFFKLDRRLNLLLFVNENWSQSWNGDLELWSEDVKECKKSIVPIANRCVIFSTTSTSFHGVPKPINCPLGITRNSIALYYYSNGRPQDERRNSHPTLWKKTTNDT